ncbi:MAG: hypothetical protein ACK5II_11265 [Paracoccus sp. (in: a-proteobacteria)]
MKISLLVCLFLVAILSCQERKELELNLKGNIESIDITKRSRKHLNQKFTENHKIDNDFNEKKGLIKFQDNKIFKIEYYGWSNGYYCSTPIDKYDFFYKNDNLDYVMWTNYYKCQFNFYKNIPQSEFEFNFDIDKPNVEYANDSIVRNSFGDILKKYYFDMDNKLIKLYNYEYEYDSLNNWTQRKVFLEGYLIEHYSRDIKYNTTHNIGYKQLGQK